MATKEFTVKVECNGGKIPHEHTIVVNASEGVYGASPPTRVRLQYTCPVTSKNLVATFEPPVGAARPFAVVKID